MEIQAHVNSVFNSLSYNFKSVLVDPGDEWEGFEEVDAVLLTHAHFDHIYGLNKVLARNSGLKVYTNEAGRAMLFDARKNLSRYHEMPFTFDAPDRIVVVSNGEDVNLNVSLIAKAVFTPGHNPSCITWVIGSMVFSGDSFIPGIKTVTNLPGGNRVQAKESEALIRQLAAGRTIFPGHKA